MRYHPALITTRMRLSRLVWTAGASLAITLTALPAATGAMAATGAPAARADETTISQDSLRTSWDQGESAMSPSQVTSFSQRWARQVTGQVWAQPLVVNGTVIVATEKDKVYGLDQATGAIKWSKTVGKFYTITSCNDLSPDVGVTGGPVLDPSTGDVDVMAQIKPGTNPLYSMFALNPATGAIVKSIGVPLHPTNASSLTFSGKNQLARPGLLALGGWVYVAFGSHCDHKPYVGYVAGFNMSSGARTLWADETGSANNQAGIWQGGGGLMSDGSGRIFFTSGNGVSPSPGAGKKPPGQLAESVVRLGKNSTGKLFARDFFSPSNAPALDSADTDWGSGSPMGLPLGTGTYPHVLAQVGKDGRFFLLNRNSLGGRNSSNNNAALSVTSAFNGEWGHPAVFADTSTLSSGNAAGANDYVYYIGKGDNLRFLKFGVNGSDKPTLSQIANSTVSFGYSSGSPAVTSSGSDPSSAVVWAVYANNAAGGGTTLEAFPGTPSAAGWPSGCTTGCTVHPLASWPIGTVAAKFTNVATSGNMVFVGTRSGATSSGGTVYAYGAPPAAAPVAPAPAASLGQAPVNSTATKSVTLTATKTVTVTGVSASTGAVGSPPPPGTPAPAQFAVNTGKVTSSTIRTPAPSPSGSGTPTPIGTGTPSPTTSQVRFPVTLQKGDKLTVPVTFNPTAPGGATGTVTFATSAGPQSVAVAAVGTTTGLYANQQSVQFALVNDIGQFESDVPVGIEVPREFNIVNGGTQPLKISSVSAPGGPYTVLSGPQPGDVLKPGESQVVQIQFAPTTPGNDPATYSITGDDGTTASVRLTGAGLPPTGLFKASPSAVNFGPVKAGKTANAVITLTNTGNEPATVVTTSPLVGPFTRTIQMTPQLPVNAGYDVRAPISFTPRHKGTFTTYYTFTWSDITGTHTLSVKITGKGV